MSQTQEQDLDKPEAEANDAKPGETPKEGEAKAQELNYAREYEAMKDKYMRLMAEFENFRRRNQKENFELVTAANHKLLGKLTEVLDDFGLAFDPKRKAAKPEDFEKGVRLIYNKLKDQLTDEGLEELNPVGEEFDPNVHDALMQQPSDTVPENKIIDVLQKGYKVRGRNVKHAKVIVSKGKE